EQEHRQAGVLDRGVQVPAQQAMPAHLLRQLGFLDDLNSVAGLLALAVAQLEQLLPVVDFVKFRFAVSCHFHLSTFSHYSARAPHSDRVAPREEMPMPEPYDGLRSFLKECEKHGEVKLIKAADWNLEIGALTETVSEMIDEPPALMFDEIKG